MDGRRAVEDALDDGVVQRQERRRHEGERHPTPEVRGLDAIRNRGHLGNSVLRVLDFRQPTGALRCNKIELFQS